MVLGDDGTYTYIPDAATAQTGGTDTFTITVVDNNRAAPRLGGFTALARHVLARSHPALAQRLFGAHAIEVTVDVTVTATTAPPIPADVTVGTPDPATGVVRGTLPATDANGAPLTYTVTTPPAYGRVTIRPDGSYVYVPSAAGQAYARTHPGAFDTFTVQASSGARSSFMARVAPGDQLTVPVPLAQATQRAPDRHGSTGVGTYPGSAMVSPGGRYAAVPSYGDRTVTIVDTTNGTRSVVAVNADLSEVVFGPDGGRVYVLDQSGLITVADTATGTVVGSVDLGDSGQALRFAPDGRHLFVSARSGEPGPVGRADDPHGRRHHGLSARPLGEGGFYNGVEFSPDGRRGYVADVLTGSVLIIDPATGTVLDTVSAGYGASGDLQPGRHPRLRPERHRRDDPVIHTDDDTVGPVLDVGTDAAFSLNYTRPFSPDGRYLYLLDDNGGDGADPRHGDRHPRGPDPGRPPSDVVFSPDGSRAYVVSGNEELQTFR